MGGAIKPTNGHKSVPTIVLNPTPSGHRSDHPKVGKQRGHTRLPEDTAGFGVRVTAPGGKKQKTR